MSKVYIIRRIQSADMLALSNIRLIQVAAKGIWDLDLKGSESMIYARLKNSYKTTLAFTNKSGESVDVVVMKLNVMNALRVKELQEKVS